MANSFLEKLRLDNLYPALPFSRIREREPEMPQRITGAGPMDTLELAQRQNMLRKIAEDTLAPTPSPESTRNVVFQPPLSDQVQLLRAKQSMISPYQQGLLEAKEADRELKAQQQGSQSQLAERKMTDAEKKTAIAEIRENKRMNEQEKTELIGRIESGQIEQRGQIESEQIGQRGEEERKTEGVRQTGRESLAEMQARHKREQAQFESTLPPRTGDLPSQQAKDFQNKYSVLINQKPEYRKFVTLNRQTGMPEIVQPGSTWLGGNSPTQEQFNEISRFIFGGTSAAAPLVTTPAPVTTATPKPDPLGIRK